MGPYFMNRYRSNFCNELSLKNVNEKVKLAGWVHRIRDHGGVFFVDLRDHYGITQIVVDQNSTAFNVAQQLRSEWVLSIEGIVTAREAEAINTNLATGEIEIAVSYIEVLSKALELPLPIFGEPDYPEDIRLKYRFLDLRREKLHKNIMQRTKIIAYIRGVMEEIGFTEFATPILTASSPEGARDFLIPSRIHNGKFYALPQAPQQYKQLLMMAGFDKYFQIAPCFRDEDPRADRLPGEFYQLDVEMSFVEQADIFAIMEPIFKKIFTQFANGKKVSDFHKITYDQAIKLYGSDKPDLRNPIRMADVSEYFRNSTFKIFASILNQNQKAQIWAIPAPTGGSRAFCDKINSWAQNQGQAGLGYIFWRSNDGVLEAAGPIAKNLGAQACQKLAEQLNLNDGDACFFVAGLPHKFYNFAGHARTKIGEELNLLRKDCFELAWIIDFPFYEWNEEAKKVEFSHNPFSMPQGGLEALINEDPLTIKAFQYDIVCNGYEIASGGIRNHLPQVMLKAFEIAGFPKDEVEKRFGALYNAFHYGAPPHGGLAAGIDRIVMLLLDEKTVRDVALFPMNQQANDLLMNAPAPASLNQLKELGIELSDTKLPN